MYGVIVIELFGRSCFGAFVIFFDIKVGVLAVSGEILNNGLISFCLSLEIFLFAIDIGFLDQNDGGELRIVVGFVDGFVESFKRVVIFLKVDIAVALKSHDAGCDDFVISISVVEISESFFIFASLI